MSGAYYNEFDPFAAEWLRRLILFGHIAPGDVDERSIEDVNPDDLRGYDQHHFFAGIGVWSHALRRAGWEDDRPIWTGSCPCQPFSAAGKGGGVADERHLWPAFFHLIGERRPGVVLGEQVASKDGLGWLDIVQADMEGAGYAFGANDLCAAGFGAPHIRQRLYFAAIRLADTDDEGLEGRDREHVDPSGRSAAARHSRPRGVAHGLADANLDRQSEGRLPVRSGGQVEAAPQQSGPGETFGLADPHQEQRGRQSDGTGGHDGRGQEAGRIEGDGEPSGGGAVRRPGPVNGFWRDADWLSCRDGKWRPVEPGTFPLAHGAPARVGRLRGYGNAICAPVAQGFIEAVMECMP